MTAPERTTKPITCACGDFEPDRDDLAPDGMCVCGHQDDDHAFDGDYQPCLNTDTGPRRDREWEGP